MLKSSLEKIKDSNEFREWKSAHIRGYLADVFFNDDIVQFDFYDPETDKMTSFRFEDDVVFSEESEVFRKEKKEIKELSLDLVKVSLDRVEELIEKLMDNDYKDEGIQKKLVILNMIDFPVWNVTYVTTKLNVLNVKVNAASGEIIEHKSESIFNFQA